MGLKAFEALNPWRLVMLPQAFKSYQGLSAPARSLVLALKRDLQVFPPDKARFELRVDLNAPIVAVRALSERHLRVEMNAQYHLLRGECVVVHLAEKALGGHREKRTKIHDRSGA